MKRLIIILILVGLLAGGFYAFQQFQARRAAAAATTFETVRAETGDLTATVGATGVVRANQTAVLTWQTTGSVANVEVQIGDSVEAGQVLAELAKTSLSQNIILAQADLATAQKALEDLYDTEFALAQAEQALAQAQDALENQEYRTNSLSAPASQVDIDQAKATVLLAKIQLDKAWDRYRPYENKDESNPVRAALFQQYTEAQKKYDQAVRRLNNLQGTVSQTTRTVSEADLALARANLVEAQRTYDRIKAGPDSSEVAAAQARIEAAQAALNLAHLTAPFDGVITDVNIKPGDQIAPGSVAFRLDDLSILLVDVQVSEVDINRITVGQDVALTFDAIPNQEYQGRVTQVGLVGAAAQGVVDFTVTVVLTEPDEQVRPGMTAAVNIVVDQVNDVLVVPNRAVRAREGKRVVYLLRNGQAEPVEVRLGASSDTMSQVLDGELEVGDSIILNPPTTFESNGPPPFVR